MSVEMVEVSAPCGGIEKLLRLADNKLACHLRLRGPTLEAALAIDFLPIYCPRPPAKRPQIVPLLGIPKKYIAPIYSLVLGLNLPEKDPAAEWPEDNQLLRSRWEGGLANKMVPSVLLALGRTGKGELTADLFFLPGISPQTALKELKQAVSLAQGLIAGRN